METPYHLLSDAQALERRELGARRCKERHCLNPWYAKGAMQAVARGNEPGYWKGLWDSHVNLVHRPTKSSNQAGSI